MKEEIIPFIERHKYDYYYHDLDHNLIHDERSCSVIYSNNVVKFKRDLFADYTRYDIPFCDKCSGINNIASAMVQVMVGLVMFPVIASRFSLYHFHEVYIDSPSGKHYKFPYYQALRILRKHEDWNFSEVEPIKKLSRWQYFKKALELENDK